MTLTIKSEVLQEAVAFRALGVLPEKFMFFLKRFTFDVNR